jgi:hypothetical protein
VLEITVRLKDYYDEEARRFIVQDVKLQLEHSLLSLSKWESEFEKPFLVPGAKTDEEILGYIRAMILTPDFPPETLDRLSRDAKNLEAIHNYIGSSQSGSTVPEQRNQPKTNERITSELIYYWLASYQIPFQPAETWHLSRLFMLVKIFGVKNAPKDKKARAQSNDERRAENARRRAEFQSRG